jgi:phosphoheptose isomerase
MVNKFFKNIELRRDLLARLKSQSKLFAAAEMIEVALKTGNKILACGNGGSATQADHFVSELVNKLYLDRPGLPAVSLVANPGNLTSIANDTDFTQVFARQVEALGDGGDILLSLTTSGKSANVLEAVRRAADKGLKSITLCGKFTEALAAAGGDILVDVDCTDTPAIQEMHLFMLHTLADWLETKLSGL